MTKLTLTDIHLARKRISDAIYQTPCAHSEVLSKMLGCDLFLKLENLQITGSFKERGALNKILQLDADKKAAGIIAASAGNHAQGVAHVAAQHGITATIVMPETTPLASTVAIAPSAEVQEKYCANPVPLRLVMSPDPSLNTGVMLIEAQ